jgi:hypothetical protein
MGFDVLTILGGDTLLHAKLSQRVGNRLAALQTNFKKIAVIIIACIARDLNVDIEGIRIEILLRSRSSDDRQKNEYPFISPPHCLTT